MPVPRANVSARSSASRRREVAAWPLCAGVGVLALVAALAHGTAHADDADGLPTNDLATLFRRTIVQQTRVTVLDPAAPAPNTVVLTRTAPVRLKGAKPSEVSFVFVVNEQAPDAPRPADGIVPVINEKVVRLLDQARTDWTERARSKAREEFGRVPVRFEETLYNDIGEKHLARLKAEGYVEKTEIALEGETARMKLLVREHYAPRSARDVVFEATVTFAPTLRDTGHEHRVLAALTPSPAPVSQRAVRGNLAALDPKHLDQVRRLVEQEVEFAMAWFARDTARPVSLQELSDARATGTSLEKTLRYPWFGESRTMPVRIEPSATPPAGSDADETWSRPR